MGGGLLPKKRTQTAVGINTVYTHTHILTQLTYFGWRAAVCNYSRCQKGETKFLHLKLKCGFNCEGSPRLCSTAALSHNSRQQHVIALSTRSRECGVGMLFHHHKLSVVTTIQHTSEVFGSKGKKYDHKLLDTLNCARIVVQSPRHLFYTRLFQIF